MTKMHRLLLSLITAALVAVPSLARAKVVVVRTGDAAVITELAQGFRAAHPGEKFEDIEIKDAKGEAALAKRLSGATAILSIGAKAGLAVANAKPTGRTIAVVPPSQADPAKLGPTMRLQPPADGMISAVIWMSTGFRRIGLVLEAGAIERQKIAEVEAGRRGVELKAALAKDGREVINAVNDLVTKVDIVLVDVSEGLKIDELQFLLRAAQDAKIPLLGTSEGFVKAGAPGAVTIDPRNVGAEAGRLTKEGASGLFDPRRFRLMVNTVVMDRLGVSVPRDRGILENNILVLDTDIDELGTVARPVTLTKPAVARQGRLTFPPIAHSSIRSAEVVLEVLVKADGSLGEAKVLKGDEAFAKAAVDSLKTWQFKPGTRDGTPVDAAMKLNLKFQR